MPAGCHGSRPSGWRAQEAHRLTLRPTGAGPGRLAATCVPAWLAPTARSGLCLAAARQELRAARDYRPGMPQNPTRCVGYLAGPSDPDRRPGLERWPYYVEGDGGPKLGEPRLRSGGYRGEGQGKSLAWRIRDRALGRIFTSPKLEACRAADAGRARSGIVSNGKRSAPFTLSGRSEPAAAGYSEPKQGV
jgi:hypothetical protein